MIMSDYVIVRYYRYESDSGAGRHLTPAWPAPPGAAAMPAPGRRRHANLIAGHARFASNLDDFLEEGIELLFRADTRDFLEKSREFFFGFIRSRILLDFHMCFNLFL